MEEVATATEVGVVEDMVEVVMQVVDMVEAAMEMVDTEGTVRLKMNL